MQSMKAKRIIIATLLGLIFGFVCYGMASSGSAELSLPVILSIILSRMLIGFVIGISNLNLKHWSIHGLLMGLLVGLPAALGAISGPENPEFPHTIMFTSTIVMGLIYGFLIELVTSVVFKAKQQV